jgi:hypothetical protein
VGSKTEIFSVRFGLEAGMHGQILGTIFNAAETEVGAPTMIVPDGWLYSPMYIEIDGTPSISAEIKAVKNGKKVFGGAKFDIHRIVMEESGIVEVEDPPLLRPEDQLEFYLDVRGKVDRPCTEEILVHMVIAPEKGLRS